MDPAARPPGAASVLSTVLLASTAHGQACDLQRVSLTTSGGEANGSSFDGAISADGRHVVFQSSAANVVAGDFNANSDLFLRDRLLGTTALVSLSSSGEQAASDSEGVRMTPDARFLTFHGGSWNLVAGDTNSKIDVFLRDLALGITERVSVDTSGVQGNGDSFHGAASDDGRYVAFQSRSTNLVPADTNGGEDVFVRDRLSATTERVSISSTGAQSDGHATMPEVSADGRFVLFRSTATNLVPGDTNQNPPWLVTYDLFVRDRVAGTTERVNLSSAGAQDDSGIGVDRAGMSGDGRYVVFSSRATTLAPGVTTYVARIYLRDRQLGTTTLVSRMPGGAPPSMASSSPMITADGRFVAFTSWAALAPEDTDTTLDAYLWDAQTDAISLVSHDPSVPSANADSFALGLSADGRTVAFGSSDAALVAGDTNGVNDVLVRDCADLASAYCFGTATACPCANSGTDGAGCDNSFATGGGKLTVNGTASVGSDTLQLACSGLGPTAPVLFFQGTSGVAGGLGQAFGDGLRCAGGGVMRLGSKAASGGAAAYGAGIPGDPAISVRGRIPATGGVRHYQSWYRNQVSFCTASAFNLTNGMRVVWTP